MLLNQLNGLSIIIFACDQARSSRCGRGLGPSIGHQAFPNILQEVCLPVVVSSTCRRAFATEGFHVTHDMFCTGPATGGKDVCKGDSGGGYVYQDPGYERRFLGGLVSWGSSEGCALPVSKPSLLIPAYNREIRSSMKFPCV